MNRIDKKQKLIIILIAIVSIICIYYLIFSKEKNNNIEELENVSIENTTEEVKENNKIIIHISGAVQKEGVLELGANSRISDAIELAGGLKENACLDDINLAEVIEDGIKINIPTKEEVNNQEIKTNTQTSKNQNVIQDSNKAEQKNTKGKININTASQSELESLPGIGASTANKIIEYRQKNGKFKSIENIKDVKGIGDSKYNKIKNYISIN